jgi:hypothetical protein
VLPRTELSTGELLVAGQDQDRVRNSEEDYADAYIRQRLQPFRIEDEAKRLRGTNFIVAGRFKAHAMRDGPWSRGSRITTPPMMQAALTAADHIVFTPIAHR